VQAVSVGQLIGVPAQAPDPSQESRPVETTPSSHVAPASACVTVQSTPVGAWVVQAVSAGHWMGVPAQAPAALQRSFAVARVPSSQAVVADA
jgi:hypothetical protein